jgi:hypothetical protein
MNLQLDILILLEKLVNKSFILLFLCNGSSMHAMLGMFVKSQPLIIEFE